VGQDLLLFAGEVEFVEHLGVSGRLEHGFDVADPRKTWLRTCSLMPSRMRFSVEMLSATT
jgi:hypothetical protein